MFQISFQDQLRQTEQLPHYQLSSKKVAYYNVTFYEKKNNKIG